MTTSTGVFTPSTTPTSPLSERSPGILDHHIATSIGALIVPTIRHAQWGSANPLTARADHIDATLAAAGWLVDPGSDDDPLCDARRVAQELDIYPTTARRWMADGTLPTVTLPDATGVSRRYPGSRMSRRIATASPGGSSCPTSQKSSASPITRPTTPSAGSASPSTSTPPAASTTSPPRPPTPYAPSTSVSRPFTAAR